MIPHGDDRRQGEHSSASREKSLCKEEVRFGESRMKIETLIERRQPCRRVQGIAAALLPYEAGGRVAVEAFQRHLVATHRAGLMNAVNMDTGYVHYLSETKKHDVLRWTREALGKDAQFVAGAYVEGQEGDEALVAGSAAGARPAGLARRAAARVPHLHRKRPGHRHDRIRVGLLAGAGGLRAGEICRARPVVGSG